MFRNLRGVRRLWRLAVALALAWMPAGPARAQGASGVAGGVDQLFGWVRPQDSDQPSKLATLRIDLSGGADRNPERSDVGDLPRDDAAGTLAGSTRYWSGRTDEFLEVSAAAWGTYQRLAEDTLMGAEFNAQLAREIGQRMGFSVATTGAYRPSLVFGGGGLMPEAAPTVSEVTHPQGVLTQQWLMAEATTGFFRDWTSRQRMNVELTAAHQRPSEGIGLRSRSEALQARHEWAFRERAVLLFSYRFSDNQQSGVLATRPIRMHAASTGIRVEHRYSPSRSLMMTLAGGPTRVTLPAQDGAAAFYHTALSGWGLLQWTMSRNWSLSGEGTRYVSALDGLTPEPFTTDTGTVTLGGTVGERYTVALVGVASQGSSITASTASFEARSATAQFQYAIARRWVLFGSYSYYSHRLSDLVALPETFPQRFNRHSLRIGLSLGVPLYRGR